MTCPAPPDDPQVGPKTKSFLSKPYLPSSGLCTAEVLETLIPSLHGNSSATLWASRHRQTGQCQSSSLCARWNERLRESFSAGQDQRVFHSHSPSRTNLNHHLVCQTTFPFPFPLWPSHAIRSSSRT